MFHAAENSVSIAAAKIATAQIQDEYSLDIHQNSERNPGTVGRSNQSMAIVCRRAPLAVLALVKGSG